VQIASPIFLIALFPWAALVLWLLLGKRRRVNVSFLELWKGPVSGPTARRRIGMPPLALMAALGALLLMILAAARPGIPKAASAGDVPVVVVVDRGITMSMGKPQRFLALLEEIKPVIRDRFGEARVETVFVPGGNVKSAAGTALDTRGMVEVVVREQLEANPASPLIVLSDQDLKIENQRVVSIAPKTAARNVSIVHIAARIFPVAQVMVGLRNQSSQTRTAIRVLCDGRESARQEVELPAMGQARDYFLPIEPSAKVIRAEVEAVDDFAGDNVAFLVRRGSWPMIEVRTPVFAELQRLVEKYSKLRPPGEEAKRVEIISSDGIGAGAEIILSKPGPAGNGKASVVDHPVMAALEKVDWESLARDGLAEPVGDGWKSVLRIGEKTAIAVRETPARQVWVGISMQKLASSPEFVILWSNIFDWVGGGGEEFVAQTTGQLEAGWRAVEAQPQDLKPGWWPGIYHRSDGALLAVNAPDVPLSRVKENNWRAQMAELAREFREATRVRWLTTPLLLAAMILLVVAVLTWRGGLRRTVMQTVAAKKLAEARA